MKQTDVEIPHPTSLLNATSQQGALKLSASGEWTAPNATALDQTVGPIMQQPDHLAETSINMAGVRALDTYGAWHLARLVHIFEARGQKTAVVGLADKYFGLFETVRAASADVGSVEVKPPQAGPATIGKTMVDGWRCLALFINMLGAVCDAILRVARRPSTFRLTSTVHPLDRVGWPSARQSLKSAQLHA